MILYAKNFVFQNQRQWCVESSTLSSELYTQIQVHESDCL